MQWAIISKLSFFFIFLCATLSNKKQAKNSHNSCNLLLGSIVTFISKLLLLSTRHDSYKDMCVATWQDNFFVLFWKQFVPYLSLETWTRLKNAAAFQTTKSQTISNNKIPNDFKQQNSKWFSNKSRINGTFWPTIRKLTDDVIWLARQRFKINECYSKLHLVTSIIPN
jgi:hypothetical protein